MRVAFFTNAYKPIINGVVNSVILFKHGLEARGNEVYIFAPMFTHYSDYEDRIYRFRSINLTSKVKYPIPVPFSRRLFKLIPKLKLDIIHTQHPFLLGEVGAYFSRKLRIPLVYTFHTQFEQYSHYIPFNQEIVKWITRTSVIKYINKCDCIITPSPSVQKLIEDYGITKKVKILPNAVNTSVFEGLDPLKIREKYRLPKDEIVLIYVGRMAIEKNLPFLLKAFKVVVDKVKKTRLLVVGEGPELNSLKLLAEKLGLKQRVAFTGRVEYNNIPHYYAASDIFVITSVTEVKPLAIMEAMAAGLPVVGVEGPGAQDTVTPGLDGILTKLEVDDFANELIKLIESRDLLKDMSRHAKHNAQKYSIHEVTKDLLKIYSSLR